MGTELTRFPLHTAPFCGTDIRTFWFYSRNDSARIYPDVQGVPAARQKLMAKGAWKGILKDDIDLSGCDIKDGQQVRLPPPGPADTVPYTAAAVVLSMDSTCRLPLCDLRPAGYTAALVRVLLYCFTYRTYQVQQYLVR